MTNSDILRVAEAIDTLWWMNVDHEYLTDFARAIEQIVVARGKDGSVEQRFRDAMTEMGFPEAQGWSSGGCMFAAIAAAAPATHAVTDAMKRAAEQVFIDAYAPDRVPHSSDLIHAAIAAALGPARENPADRRPAGEAQAPAGRPHGGRSTV